MAEKSISDPTWKPEFLAEYSPWMLDFQRYNDWLKYVEDFAGQIGSTDIPQLYQVQGYFSGLNVLYKLWRPLMGNKIKKQDIDDALDECRKMKRMWEQSQRNGAVYSEVLKLKLVDKLDQIHVALMDMKQIIGLGIPVRRQMSASERIKHGIGNDKKWKALPEA